MISVRYEREVSRRVDRVYESQTGKNRLTTEKLQGGGYRAYRGTDYSKSPKFSDTQNVCYNQPKIQTKRFFYRKIYPKCADKMANSADPDQTAPLGLH